MATQQLEIVITGDSKKARAALKKAGISIDSMKPKLRGLGGVMKNFKKNWLAITAALGVAAVVVKKSFNFTKDFQKMQQGMAALARNTGQSSDKIIDKLREVSKGTIANRDLVLAANRSVALNVTNDVGKMAQLLDIARVKAKAMGIDTTQAFNDIVTGIGRGSPLILDNLGIITKGWGEEATAAGVAMDQQFILNKILKQGAEELGRVGARTLTAAEKFQRMGAAMTNAKDSIGKALTVAILPLIQTIAKLLDLFTKLPGSIKLFIVSFIVAMSAAIAITKLFGITLTVATGGISALVGAVVAGAILMVQHWEKVKFAFEVAWAAIKIGLLESASFMLEIIPKMFAPMFVQIDLVIKALNRIPKVNLKTLSQMTTDLASAADAQMKIEKSKLTVLLDAENTKQAAIKKTQRTQKEGSDATNIAWSETAEKIKEKFGNIVSVVETATNSIFSLGDTIHKAIMDNILAENEALASQFDERNIFTERLAEIDEAEKATRIAGLKSEIKFAKSAGNMMLADEKATELKRILLSDAEDKRNKEIADEKAKFAKKAQTKIAIAENKAAKFSKAKAVMDSTIGTAVAVVKVLHNPILAAIVGGLGLAKTAIIKAQPIPRVPSFAQGGDFVTSGPQIIQVGDNPSGRERVQITPEGESSSSGGINIENLVVRADDPEAFISQLEELAQNTGSRLLTR